VAALQFFSLGLQQAGHVTWPPHPSPILPQSASPHFFGTHAWQVLFVQTRPPVQPPHMMVFPQALGADIVLHLSPHFGSSHPPQTFFVLQVCPVGQPPQSFAPHALATMPHLPVQFGSGFTQALPHFFVPAGQHSPPEQVPVPPHRAPSFAAVQTSLQPLFVHIPLQVSPAWAWQAPAAVHFD
jgi:hypothetical protein